MIIKKLIKAVQVVVHGGDVIVIVGGKAPLCV
jgi:hypothetical protein